MKRFMEKNILSLLPALLVSAALAQSIFESTYAQVPIWQTLLGTSIALLLFTAVFYNRITTLVSCAIASVLILIYFAPWKGEISFMTEFLGWVFGRLFGSEPYLEEFHWANFGFFIMLFSLIIYLFGSKFVVTPIIFLLPSGIFMMQWWLGHTLILYLLPMLLVGFILYLSVTWQTRIGRKERVDTHPYSIAWYTLPLAALIVILPYTVVSHAETSLYSWRVDSKVGFITDYISDWTHFSRSRSAFSLRSTGLGGSTLGGSVVLDDTPVLKVQSAQPSLLLRGSIKVEYDGFAWKGLGDSNRYRASSGNWSSFGQEIFGLDKPLIAPSAQISASDLRKYYKDVTIKITPLVKGSSSLFTPDRVTGLSFDKSFHKIAYFNNKGELFATKDVDEGEKYTVYSNMLGIYEDGFDSFILNLEKAVEPQRDEQWESVRNTYLQLPDTIDPAVYTLTDQVTGGIPEGFAQVMAIRDFLRNNYTYSLNPGDLPEDAADFVSYFLLQKKQGYCSYYASAMTVMARIAGYPARYVEGYYVRGDKTADGFFTVTNENAHAWCEVYLGGIGWIPVDSVSWAREQAVPQGGGTPTLPEGPPEETMKPITPQPVDTQPVEEPSFNFTPYVWVLSVVGGFVILLILSIGFYYWLISDLHIRRRYSNRSQRVLYYFEQIDGLLGKFECIRKEGETLQVFSARVDNWMKVPDANYAQLAEVVTIAAYSQHTITREQVRDTLIYYRKALKYMRRSLGMISFGWYLLTHGMRLAIKGGPSKSLKQ